MELTPGQVRILTVLSAEPELTYEQLAEKVHFSYESVSNQLFKIRKVAGVRTTKDLVAWWNKRREHRGQSC